MHLLRKRFFIYIQISIFLVGATYLLFRHDKLSVPSSWGIPHYSVDPAPVGAPQGSNPAAEAGYNVGDLPSSAPSRPDEKGGDAATGTAKPEADKPTEATADASPSPTATPKPTKEELTAKARTYIPSILDPNNTSIDRMFCPPINTTRYASLKPSTSERKQKYFIALNLRKCVDLLPRLLGSLLETINFLGAEHCAVSIVEGNSDDGTIEVLELLKAEFQRMNVVYHLRSTPLDPSAGDRIQKLAALRAMALTPITGVYIPDTYPEPKSNDPIPSSSAPPTPISLADGATVLFLNDVAACPDDMLELLHQRALQSADMTCAMDWTHPGPDPLFYDVWVSRALNGDLFFDIPDDPVTWDHAKDLFWNEPVARSRLAAGVPFQVFACWNGAVTFAAEPVVKREVWFRAAKEGECFQGEPQLFCKDLWYKGYGKIAVVPSVNLEYTDEAGRRVKKEKGYVGEWIVNEQEQKNGTSLKVPWKLEPPEMVKCMPMFDRQDWMPWNESLPL
ncbi:Family 69 glycosyltransferase [Coniochaeta hoffmannii]|uniref:Family 69 glycosyltransferase n=1 Tax=Coniochaeta hoffmannii TaxID=91930 RepID=A0AA38W3B1_9PEZI|nr:Family 69 glycosyltransferase [Coniochaeta hoffmannii]